MIHHITQRELRKHAERIMRALNDDQSFIVTRRGEPVGVLLPLRRRRHVDTRTVLEIFRSAPKVDRAAFVRDLDDVVDQSIVR